MIYEGQVDLSSKNKKQTIPPDVYSAYYAGELEKILGIVNAIIIDIANSVSKPVILGKRVIDEHGRSSVQLGNAKDTDYLMLKLANLARLLRDFMWMKLMMNLKD